MQEVAAPLRQTGSIARGLSIPAMFEMVARQEELVVSDELRDAWGAMNSLYTHIDNRIDGDHPESKPDGAADEMVWDPWFEYLENASVDAPMPESNDLTVHQAAAFSAMRTHLDTLRLPASQRMELIISLRQYVSASRQVKQAQQIGGVREGFAYWRQREALAIAHLFTSIVPVHGEDGLYGRDKRFASFMHVAEGLGRTAKLLDAAWDMKRDARNNNLSLEPSRFARIRLAGRGLLQGVGVVGERHRPRELKAFIMKAYVMVKNRKGNLNAQRVHA
jgi:hypothetical protein